MSLAFPVPVLVSSQRLMHRSQYTRKMAMTSSNLSTVLETNLPIGEPIRGKVRDCYRLDISEEAHMLIVSTDRVSAFDWVLPTPIPGKGNLPGSGSVS